MSNDQFGQSLSTEKPARIVGNTDVLQPNTSQTSETIASPAQAAQDRSLP
jgi:hypothetical protein